MTDKQQLKFYATPDERAWIAAHGGATAAISALIRDAIAREAEPPALVAAVRDLATMVERLAAAGWTTTLVPTSTGTGAPADDDIDRLKNAFSLF